MDSTADQRPVRLLQPASDIIWYQNGDERQESPAQQYRASFNIPSNSLRFTGVDVRRGTFNLSTSQQGETAEPMSSRHQQMHPPDSPPVDPMSVGLVHGVYRQQQQHPFRGIAPQLPPRLRAFSGSHSPPTDARERQRDFADASVQQDAQQPTFNAVWNLPQHRISSHSFDAQLSESTPESTSRAEPEPTAHFWHVPQQRVPGASLSDVQLPKRASESTSCSLSDPASSSASSSSSSHIQDVQLQDEECWVCQSTGDCENLIAPCMKCTGSLKYIHRACLQEWILSHSNRKWQQCPNCKTHYSEQVISQFEAPAARPSPFDGDTVFVSSVTAVSASALVQLMRHYYQLQRDRTEGLVTGLVTESFVPAGSTMEVAPGGFDAYYGGVRMRMQLDDLDVPALLAPDSQESDLDLSFDFANGLATDADADADVEEMPPALLTDSEAAESVDTDLDTGSDMETDTWSEDSASSVPLLQFTDAVLDFEDPDYLPQLLDSGSEDESEPIFPQMLAARMAAQQPQSHPVLE